MNDTSYRIIVRAKAELVQVYVQWDRRNYYASATFNNSATEVKVSHAGSNLVTWPLYLSGRDLADLEAIIP